MLKITLYVYLGAVTLWAILGILAYIMLQVTRSIRRHNTPADTAADTPAE